jgi:hypothetical protein
MKPKPVVDEDDIPTVETPDTVRRLAIEMADQRRRERSKPPPLPPTVTPLPPASASESGVRTVPPQLVLTAVLHTPQPRNHLPLILAALTAIVAIVLAVAAKA